MTPPVNIELLEEVVKKATPGEWKSSYVNETGVMVIVDEKGFAVLSCDWLLDTDEDVQEIVALHNASGALIAEIKAGRRVVEAARRHKHPTACVAGMPCELQDAVAAIDQLSK